MPSQWIRHSLAVRFTIIRQSQSCTYLEWLPVAGQCTTVGRCLFNYCESQRHQWPACGLAHVEEEALVEITPIQVSACWFWSQKRSNVCCFWSQKQSNESYKLRRSDFWHLACCLKCWALHESDIMQSVEWSEYHPSSILTLSEWKCMALNDRVSCKIIRDL